MGEFAMHRRIEVFVAAAAASLAGAVQPAAAQPAPPATAEVSVSVPRDVLERYVGRYALRGTIATIALTGDGQLTSQLPGQSPAPLRAVGTNEFVIDAVGVRLVFEGEGPKAARIRSRFNGEEVVGTRIAEGAAGTPGPGPAAIAFDAAARKDAVTRFGTALRERYVVPEVGERAAARIDAALAAGEYDGLADPAAFAARLSADVSAVAHDKHLRIESMDGPPRPPPGAGTPLPRSEGGVVRADKLAGGVGYIEVIAFPGRAGFKPAIDPALSGLADSTALIIDLRRNIGGLPEGVAYLVSFLLPPDEPVHISDIVTRVAGTSEVTRESFISEPTPVSFADRPVYVLISSGTFSAGEAFAYDVKALGRGVLVGEVTGGGANPSMMVPLGNGLITSIPVARAENAVTGTNWEGRGVEPDVAVAAADALGEALRQLGQQAVPEIAAASQQQVFAPRTTPLIGSEAALRAVVGGVTREPTDLSAFGPRQAEMLRPQLPQVQGHLRSLGAIESVRFAGPGLPAGDEFEVTFANGALVMNIIVAADGSVEGFSMRPASP